MAEEEDIAALESALKKQEAVTARLKAKIAAAKAAQAAPPAPVAAAPLPVAVAKPAQVFVRKAPSLKVPEAYGGTVLGDKGREVALFSKRHRELAAQHGGVRDHAAWQRYWDPESNTFKPKGLKVNGRNLYHGMLAQGHIVPPRGYYFNTRTNSLVHEDTVFTAKGALKAAYMGMGVKGRLLKEGGKEVTVECFLYFPMTYEDEDRKVRRVTKAIYEQRKDLSLRYVVDPDGYYHQEQRELLLNTTEEVLAKWLPSGRVWWVKNQDFKDFVRLEDFFPGWVGKVSVPPKEPIALASSVRKHAYGTFGDHLRTFASSVSAFQFKNPAVREATPAFDALALKHHGKPAMVFSPFTDAMSNKAATRLEDWIVRGVTEDLPTEGGSKQRGVVVPIVLPPDTGCGYEFIISTFAQCFADLKMLVDAKHPRGRYADVEMTPQWLHANIFFPPVEGQPTVPFDPANMGLSLGTLRLFFEKFRVSLFVLDITGRLVESACFIPESVNERVRPNSAFVLAHNEHLYPITGAERIKRLTALVWNANSFLWRPIHGLGKEADGEEEVEDEGPDAPNARFSLGSDEAPIIFLPDIDALASLDVHVPKLDKKGAPKTHAKTDAPLFHQRLRIAVPASMSITLVDLVERANYEPRVTMSGLGEILSLTIKVEGVSLAISAPHHLVPEPADGDRQPWLPTEAIHRLYCAHDAALKAALSNRQTLSAYSPSLAHAFKRQTYTLDDGRTFPVTPFYRSPLYFGREEAGPVTAVDRTKSYTSLLMEMDMVPVFTEFCEFEPLDYTQPSPPPSPPPSPQVPDRKAPVTHTVVKPLKKPEPWVFKREGWAPTVRHFLYEGPALEQGTLDSALAGGGGADPEAWRTYTDKNLADMVVSMRQQERSEEDIKHFLMVDLQQPAVRAARLQHSERERYSFYLVARSGTLFPEDPRHLILDQPYCLVTFETWLLCRDWDCCHTLAVIKPFNLVKTDIKKVVKNLWASTLPAHLKKFLPNKHVGSCGKSDNRRSNTLLFQSAVEAKGYETEDSTTLVRTLGKSTYYFVTEEWRTPLAEGFMPIHHFVLDSQRRVLYEKAMEVGKPVLGVKTDCLYFAGHDPALVKPKMGTFEAIGSWHVEQAKEHPTKPHFERIFQDEWLPPIDNEPDVLTIVPANEYDAAEFTAIFENNNHVLVLADIPGAGKTYALKTYMRDKGAAALFVTPYNALADDLKKGDNPVYDAITFHRLLGLLAHGEEAEESVDEEGNVRVRGHDISSITDIVFDEIFCYSPIMLGQLKRWMAKHAFTGDGTARNFYAAGDKNQNAPIFASCLNRLEMKAYYSRAISTMFTTQVRLQVCKRVGPEQQQRIMDIKDAVLNTDESLLSICRRFFKPITRLPQVRGRAVCFTNETARVVNDFQQQRTAKGLEGAGTDIVRIDGRIYYFSQTLRCRKFHKKPRIYINYTYTVTGFERDASGAVTGIFLEETGDFPWAPSLVKGHFIYDFAATCHSLQGMTASGGITLFEVWLWCATREWFYTALTRTDDLDQVFFWDPEAGEVTGLPVVLRNDFRLALEGRLRGYREQDTVAGRTWEPEDYIDGDAIMALHAEQDGKCAHCAAWLPPRWKDKDPDQPTVDRIDNALPHIKGNCCLACLRCNTTRH